jgi:glyoxylase-like metal-dependent hydrolase (beta-lactamase superfamily II)
VVTLAGALAGAHNRVNGAEQGAVRRPLAASSAASDADRAGTAGEEGFMHRVMVGSVEIVALLDAVFLQNPKVLTPEHADEMAQEYRDVLDERGLCHGAVTCYLIRSGGGLALVDTGIGPRPRQRFPDGHLDAVLREAQISPADINYVLHTHLHGDHVGWNTFAAADGSPEIFFPNAQFVIQQAEWDYWMDPERLAQERGALLRECVVPARESGQVLLAGGDETVLDHLRFIATPGHTPGHVAIDVADGPDRAVIIGDASHHPLHVAHPDWASPLDWDPQLAMRSRNRIYDEAAEDHRLVLGGHWTHPGWGHVERQDGRRVYRPFREEPAPARAG